MEVQYWINGTWAICKVADMIGFRVGLAFCTICIRIKLIRFNSNRFYKYCTAVQYCLLPDFRSGGVDAVAVVACLWKKGPDKTKSQAKWHYIYLLRCIALATSTGVRVAGIVNRGVYNYIGCLKHPGGSDQPPRSTHMHAFVALRNRPCMCRGGDIDDNWPFLHIPAFSCQLRVVSTFFYLFALPHGNIYPTWKGDSI